MIVFSVKVNILIDYTISSFLSAFLSCLFAAYAERRFFTVSIALYYNNLFLDRSRRHVIGSVSQMMHHTPPLYGNAQGA